MTGPEGPDAGRASSADRPEFEGVRQEGAYAGPPGRGVPQRSPADAAAEARESAAGGDRFAVSGAAERHGRALASGDLEAAVAHAAPEVRDRLKGQLRELRLDEGRTDVTVLRTQAGDPGWTVWLQLGGDAGATTLVTRWHGTADGPVLRDVTVAGDGA